MKYIFNYFKIIPNLILFCFFFNYAQDATSSKITKKFEYPYIYYDINDAWKTGYSISFLESISNKVPEDKLTVYRDTISPKSILLGNTFSFTDLAGNKTILQFSEDTVIEMANNYESVIQIEYTKNGYRFVDPLLKSIYEKSGDTSSRKSRPSSTRNFNLYTDGKNYYLGASRNSGFTTDGISGLYGKLQKLNSSASKKSITKNKVAFLHTTNEIWPNIPYKFFEKTKAKNYSYKRLIEFLVNGHFEGINENYFQSFHNIFLWRLGYYFEDEVKAKAHVTLNYDYTVTTTFSSAYGSSSNDKTDKLIVYMFPQFEEKFKEYLDQYHFSYGASVAYGNIFDVFFESLENFNDPRLQSLLKNLELYSKNKEPYRWLGKNNKIKDDFNVLSKSESVQLIQKAKLKKGNSKEILNGNILANVNEYYYGNRRKAYNPNKNGKKLFEYKVEITSLKWVPNNPGNVAPNSSGKYIFEISNSLYKSIPAKNLSYRGTNPDYHTTRQEIRDLIAGRISKIDATITMDEKDLNNGKYKVHRLDWYWTY